MMFCQCIMPQPMPPIVSAQIFRADILPSSEALLAPEVFVENRNRVGSFIRANHIPSTTLFESLDDSLGFPPSTLSKLRYLDHPSDSFTRFISAFLVTFSASKSTGGHIGFGSLTILFHRLGELQVLMPEFSSDQHQAVP